MKSMHDLIDSKYFAKLFIWMNLQGLENIGLFELSNPKTLGYSIIFLLYLIFLWFGALHLTRNKRFQILVIFEHSQKCRMLQLKMLSIGYAPKIYLRGVMPYTLTWWPRPPTSSLWRVDSYWSLFWILLHIS